MKIKFGHIFLVAILVAVSGCATMDGDECATGDWSAIGYEDGARGYTSDQLGKHRKACAKHSITPDFEAYHRGRDQGLQEYCQPSRGFNVGSNGGRYNGVCSVALEADFVEALNSGHRLYTLRSRVSNANSSIRSKEHELKEIEDFVATKESELILNETTSSERAILVADIKDLSERSGQLEAEIKDLYAVRGRSQVKLEQYEFVVSEMGY